MEKVTLNPAFINAVEKATGVVTGVREVQEYKDNKKTGNVIGSKVTVTVITGEASGEIITIKVPLNNELIVGQQVRIKIRSAKVYAKTSMNSNFASIETSLNGEIQAV